MRMMIVQKTHDRKDVSLLLCIIYTITLILFPLKGIPLQFNNTVSYDTSDYQYNLSMPRLYASPITPSLMVVNMKPCNCNEKNECHAVEIIGMKTNRYLWKCNNDKQPYQKLLYSIKSRTGRVIGIDAKHEWQHLFVDEPVVVTTADKADVALPNLFADTKASLPSLW